MQGRLHTLHGNNHIKYFSGIINWNKDGHVSAEKANFYKVGTKIATVKNTVDVSKHYSNI